VQGDTGAAGSTGPQGAAGPSGAAGTNGAAGTAGADGAAGTAGDAGPAGADGTTGPAGPQGDTGNTGPQGDTGNTGPQGSTGADGSTGATGPAGPAGAFGEYAYIYNLPGKVVGMEDDVPFSDTGLKTAGISHAPGATQIGFVTAGIYKVTYSVSTNEDNQFALFLDGAVVQGSTYGSGAGTQQNVGQVIVQISSGSVLTLRNHSSSTGAGVTLQPLAGGTQQNVNASVAIEQVG
jgi:hypothetical protein